MELVVLINEAKRGSAIVETRCKIYGVKTGRVPASSNFLCNVGADRIRIITGGRVIWRHVARSEAFIVAEAETITDASWDICKLLKKPRFDEVAFPCLPAEWGNNWKQLIAKGGIG